MAEWHPILAATEPEPGHWVLVDDLGHEYANIRILRRGDEVGYKAEFRGELVGYYRSLRAACREAHMAFVRSHGPSKVGTFGMYENRA